MQQDICVTPKNIQADKNFATEMFESRNVQNRTETYSAYARVSQLF